jgi:hypothetical protein
VPWPDGSSFEGLPHPELGSGAPDGPESPVVPASLAESPGAASAGPPPSAPPLADPLPPAPPELEPLLASGAPLEAEPLFEPEPPGTLEPLIMLAPLPEPVPAPELAPAFEPIPLAPDAPLDLIEPDDEGEPLLELAGEGPVSFDAHATCDPIAAMRNEIGRIFIANSRAREGPRTDHLP